MASLERESSTTTQQRASKILSLWKSNTTETMLKEADRAIDQRQLQRDVGNLSKHVEQINARIAVLESKQQRHDTMLSDMYDRMARVEENGNRFQSEMALVAPQVEHVSMEAERGRANTAAHEEQLQFLTEQVQMWRAGKAPSVQAPYWTILSWLYAPLLHFLKGVWVILFPLILTFQNLTILHGSRSNDNEDEESEADNRDGHESRESSQHNHQGHHVETSLLDMLRAGEIDAALHVNP